MSNPFRHHTNNLFANRGCDIDAALAYANEVITAMPTEQHAPAMTALMVVVNTAARAFDQAQGPSPEKLAVEDMIRAFVTREMDNQSDKMLEAINDAVEEKLDELLDDKINDWMNDNLEAKMEGEALCDAIRDAFRNNLSISIN